jgi:hypothetical protein
MVKVLEQKEKKRELKKQLERLSPGDLVMIEWCDASVGKSMDSGAAIDIPVKSWGIFIGVLGSRAKHIVIAQNSFRYADGVYDLDYTAIPLGWVFNVSALMQDYVPKEVAGKLVSSFMAGGHRTLKRSTTFQRRRFQQRLSIDGRPD